MAIPLSTGDVSTTETAGAAETNAISTHVHGGLHRALHGAAERNTALKLNGDSFCDELGIEFWLLDFENVDFDLLATAHFGDLLAHHVDFLTFTANDKTWTGSVKGHTDLIPCALDHDLGDRSLHEFLFQVATDGEIAVKRICIFFFRCVPLGAPVFGDCEAEADRIYFLSHKVKRCGWGALRLFRSFLGFGCLLEGRSIPAGGFRSLLLTFGLGFFSLRRADDDGDVRHALLDRSG